MFPPDVKEKAMVACGRRCCLCHKFCGVGMECHHIVPEADKGENTTENCIPLCFDCHAEVGHYSPTHPKGTKFSPGELRAHRDRWYAQVVTGTSPVAQADCLELDRKLYRRIIATLGGSFYMVHFREHDYGSPYHSGHDDCINDLGYLAELPEFEFSDTQVEGSFSDLKAAISEYRLAKVNRIWRELDGMAGIPREWLHGKNGERPDARGEKRFWESVEILNKAATKIWTAYEQFVRAARMRLAAEEPSAEELKATFEKSKAK